MRQLDYVKVEGFKSIRSMEINLRLLNVLIGANGAGKSNFISLFKLLHELVEQRLQSYVGRSGFADALLYLGQKHTNVINIELKFGSNGYKAILSPSARNSLVFDQEVALFSGEGWDQPYAEIIGSGYPESQLEEYSNKSQVASYVLKSMKQWQVYHFHDTSDSARVKKATNIDDNLALRPDAGNLAAFLYRLRHQFPPQYKLIVETIRLAAPFFDDFMLRPDPLHPGSIQLEWRQRDSDAYFNAYSLSDGTLRFICLTTLLMQPSSLLPSTILIDEPELGLHPYATTLLASMLHSAATKTQVIISTQSVPLVNQFSPEDLVVVELLNGQSVFKRLKADEVSSWLDEYGMGDLWEKNVFGGRPTR
jgi:predicted ATPase